MLHLTSSKVDIVRCIGGYGWLGRWRNPQDGIAGPLIGVNMSWRAVRWERNDWLFHSRAFLVRDGFRVALYARSASDRMERRFPYERRRLSNVPRSRHRRPLHVSSRARRMSADYPIAVVEVAR